MNRKKQKKNVPLLLFWAGFLFVLGLMVFLLAPACRFSAFGIWAFSLVPLTCFLLKKLGEKHPAAAKRLRTFFTVGLCLLLILMAVTLGFILHGARGAKDSQSQYLLVLGAGVDGDVPSLSLTERLAAAHNYLTAYPDAICVVSGGQGGGENISEAQCMYNWLTAHGIDPERILMEDRASSTAENLMFSLELLERRGEKPESIAIVSSEYHLFRAGLMAKKCGVTALGVPAHTSLAALRVNYTFREIFGVWYYLIFG